MFGNFDFLIKYLLCQNTSNYYRRSLVLLVGHLLINQSLYQEILLLQKFNDISGKVVKPKKISLQPQKKNEAVFLIFNVNCLWILASKIGN